jgi:hypothetical protein
MLLASLAVTLVTECFDYSQSHAPPGRYDANNQSDQDCQSEAAHPDLRIQWQDCYWHDIDRTYAENGDHSERKT